MRNINEYFDLIEVVGVKEDDKSFVIEASVEEVKELTQAFSDTYGEPIRDKDYKEPDYTIIKTVIFHVPVDRRYTLKIKE